FAQTWHTNQCDKNESGCPNAFDSERIAERTNEFAEDLGQWSEEKLAFTNQQLSAAIEKIGDAQKRNPELVMAIGSAVGAGIGAAVAAKTWSSSFTLTRELLAARDKVQMELGKQMARLFESAQKDAFGKIEKLFIHEAEKQLVVAVNQVRKEILNETSQDVAKVAGEIPERVAKRFTELLSGPQSMATIEREIVRVLASRADPLLAKSLVAKEAAHLAATLLSPTALAVDIVDEAGTKSVSFIKLLESELAERLGEYVANIKKLARMSDVTKALSHLASGKWALSRATVISAATAEARFTVVIKNASKPGTGLAKIFRNIARPIAHMLVADGKFVRALARQVSLARGVRTGVGTAVGGVLGAVGGFLLTDMGFGIIGDLTGVEWLKTPTVGENAVDEITGSLRGNPALVTAYDPSGIIERLTRTRTGAVTGTGTVADQAIDSVLGLAKALEGAEAEEKALAAGTSTVPASVTEFIEQLEKEPEPALDGPAAAVAEMQAALEEIEVKTGSAAEDQSETIKTKTPSIATDGSSVPKVEPRAETSTDTSTAGESGIER
ncbi:MAG: hypothetical protein AB1540_16165, partial [Bdellovibrionota bacterium]